jgi:hypothetical protein
MAVETIGVRRGVVKDQIFAAIEQHRIALAAHDAAAEDSDRDGAWDAYGEAHVALMSTRPATLEGTIALLDYMANFELAFLWFGESDDDNEATIEFIACLRDALELVRA